MGPEIWDTKQPFLEGVGDQEDCCEHNGSEVPARYSHGMSSRKSHLCICDQLALMTGT